AKPVFISYTRQHSSELAQALWQRLGDDTAYLDTADIEHDEDFVDKLIEGVLGAKVIVLFLDQTYFERRFCWLEYEVAVCLYAALVDRGEELKAALEHVIVAAPEEFPPELVIHLPEPLWRKNRVDARQTDVLAQ